MELSLELSHQYGTSQENPFLKFHLVLQHVIVISFSTLKVWNFESIKWPHNHKIDFIIHDVEKFQIIPMFQSHKNMASSYFAII